ncbi:PPC domain-containing protein [Adlercreutzia caecimuris]|uniref:PPC domain-containing protein n=1 Tax=Adlercreutzia caecimuris TaxID=671266 RepID=UPI00272DC13C|nr:PPC domain-containing protein [Adlercreutzia caecimuris]
MSTDLNRACRCALSLLLCSALLPTLPTNTHTAWADDPTAQATMDYESEPNDDMEYADVLRPGIPFAGSENETVSITNGETVGPYTFAAGQTREFKFTTSEPSRMAFVFSQLPSVSSGETLHMALKSPEGKTIQEWDLDRIRTTGICGDFLIGKGTHTLVVTALCKVSTMQLKLTFDPIGSFDYETEPNDSFDTADTLYPDKTFAGVVYDPTLEVFLPADLKTPVIAEAYDYLSFSLSSRSSVSLELATQGAIKYKLYDSNQHLLGEGETGSGNRKTTVSCGVLNKGKYFLFIRCADVYTWRKEYFVTLKTTRGTDFENAPDTAFGKKNSASWSSDQKNVYSSVNLPSAGCLKIEMSKPESSYPVMEVYDTSRNLVWSYNARDEADSSKSTYSASVGLKKGTYYVCLRSGTTYVSKTLPFTFTLTHKASTNYEAEPNENAQQATMLKLGVACSADIGRSKISSEKDFFKFTATAGKRYDIILAPREGLWDVSELSHVDVYDAAGNLKDCSSYDSLPNGTKRAVFQPTANGTYYIKVSSFSSEQVHYSITVNAFQKKTPTLKVKSSSIRRNYWKTGRFSNQVTYNGDGDLTYRSSNDKVVSVYHDGTMLTWGFGTATITVTAPETENYKGATTSFKVHVVKPSSGFKYARKSIKVPWSGSFSNKYKNLSGGKLTHKSSNKKVATINSKGLVTFKGIGATTITTTQAATSYYAKSSATYTLKIVPDAPKIKTIKAGKGSLKVRWRKLSAKQSSGYEVRCATTKSMKKAVKKTVKGAKKSSLKVSKLKKGKKYYVQVRAYKKVGGKMYYSSWSKAKAVKTKK